MNQEPLDEMVARAVERICSESRGPLSADEVTQRVFQDEDVKILLDGYRMHDRSEGLEDVIKRDIGKKVREALERRAG